MRGTWIILILMVVIGAGMYFYFNASQPKPAHHDTIVFKNTNDSIIKKMQVYLANDPNEVMYLDSVWMQADSTPLRKVLTGIQQDTMSKQYSNITLLLAYGTHSFYDLEIKKPDPTKAYHIELQIQPQENDALVINGLITPEEGDALQFQVPMLKMYSRFVVTYNHKLPQAPVDSTAIQGHEPDRTVTVLKS